MTRQATRSVTFRLTETNFEAAQKCADARDVSLSELIREAVVELLYRDLPWDDPSQEEIVLKQLDQLREANFLVDDAIRIACVWGALMGLYSTSEVAEADDFQRLQIAMKTMISLKTHSHTGRTSNPKDENGDVAQ